MAQPRLVYLYHPDNQDFCNDLLRYLSILKENNKIKDWSRKEVLAGQTIDKEVEYEIDKSDIVVVLLSVAFISDNDCKHQFLYAKKYFDANKKYLIPIILDACPWQDFYGMNKLKVLPNNNMPISMQAFKDGALSEIYEEIKKVSEEISKCFALRPDFLSEISKTEFHSQASERIDINDIFIFPNVIKQVDLTSEILIETPLQILQGGKVIICGEERSGKSKLCTHLLTSLIKEGRPVLLIDLNNILNKKASSEIFRHCYESQYVGSYDIWSQKDEKIIIFDNLSPHGKCLDHLGEARKIFDKIIITTSLDDYTSFFSDDMRLTDFTSLSIKQFTHAKQEKLIKKWLTVTRTHFDEDTGYSEIDKIENNINSIIIDNKILPRYPFFILTILQSYEAFMPKDLKITAYGHCYYVLILAHIRKSGINNDDDSINFCFNFAQHLAFEIHSLNSAGIAIDQYQYDAFVNKYKEKYIVNKAILNRLVGCNGLIKTCNGFIKFNLAYSYYYFLGQYLAANHKSCNQLIVDLVSKSRFRNNSLTLIFTIHHSQTYDILNEVLTYTICAIDDVIPAKLDKEETDVFDELLKSIPAQLSSNENIEIEREQQRNIRDIIESNASEDSTESELDEDHFLGSIYQCHKNIEILSQLLKNKSGSLEITTIREIIETICDAGLRLAKILLTDRQKLEDIVGFIQRQYKMSDKFDPNKQQSIQLSEIRKNVLFNIFVWVMGNIEKIVSSISKPELKEIIEALAREKNTPAYDIISYFYFLDTLSNFDHSARERLFEIVEKYPVPKSFFINKIISIRTQWYFKTHSAKEPIKQAVYSKLDIGNSRKKFLHPV
ncbi:TIR domain-containing protein [Methylomonas rapida]|uniref:Toll/interleukin-1 receptor domain-containing protein n=1 Tax=Methylomonas rapida TaxID=2963939 RepID=A0ABY7GHB1_9GAMM|nr:toll/interleukin-1 receptor domain-containing protein [Methylomonas rapida]WAR44645.1 toll/interleukin-1 receptor domain-containing protein [Methylomonas rapida]